MSNNTQVLVAILAKDKGHCLPLYLKCLLHQTYSKNNIHLYIRTNDNKDNTEELLTNFITEHGSKYASVFFDGTSVSENLKQYGHHEWNLVRFKALGKIRQDSVSHAKKLGVDYFVIDCDNFIVPNTLENMVRNREFGVVAPMLVSANAYSNYHFDIDANGYHLGTPLYMNILKKEIRGVIGVKVVHCVYYIHNRCLDKVCYDDASCRYEYVIFSDCLRKTGIQQHLDNLQYYGFIVFTTNAEELKQVLDTIWKAQLDEYFAK